MDPDIYTCKMLASDSNASPCSRTTRTHMTIMTFLYNSSVLQCIFTDEQHEAELAKWLAQGHVTESKSSNYKYITQNCLSTKLPNIMVVKSVLICMYQQKKFCWNYYKMIIITNLFKPKIKIKTVPYTVSYLHEC